MASEFRIRGISKPINSISPKSTKESQFEAVFKESENLVSEANTKEEESLIITPDLSFTMKSLNSISLANNSKFLDLKKQLELYHLDSKRKNPTMHREKPLKWRQLIYSCLHKLLNECVFTPSRKQQLDYLDTVYNWYYNKIGKENVLKSSATNKTVVQPLVIEEEFSSSERLAQYSRRKIKSSQNVRPKTTNTSINKNHESRPVSAVKLPIQAFIGSGEPFLDMKQVKTDTSFFGQSITDEEEIQKIEQRFLHYRNQDLAEKRLREEMKRKVDSWKVSRTRKAEEFNRKFECSRYASRTDQQVFSPIRGKTVSERTFITKKYELQDPKPEVSHTEPSEKTEEENLPVHKLSKIAAIRKFNEEILEFDERLGNPNSALNLDSSAITISPYSRNPELFSKSFERPQTAGFLPPPRNCVSRGLSGFSRPITAQRAQQIDEVYEVKNKLAKKNIQCNIDTLKHGLLMPEDLPPEKLTADNFPQFGCGLLLNPFAKIAKKKGKKKGKKSKSKKNF